MRGFRLERIILFGFTRARISASDYADIARKVLGLLRDDGWRRSREGFGSNGIKVEKEYGVIFSYLYVKMNVKVA